MNPTTLLEESRPSGSDLLAAVGHAIIATDLSGRVTFWSRAAETLYGWTADEAAGRSILDLTPSAGLEESAVEIFERLCEGESWSGEFEVRRKDGSTFLAHVTDAPIRDPEGRLIGVVGVSMDLTEYRRALTESRRARTEMGRLYDDARSAAREREEIVAIVSHDLRNPLNTVTMASGLLATGELAPEKQLQQVDLIRRAASQMTRLIDDLLDAARIRTGRLGVAPLPTDAADLVREAAAFHAPAADARQITLALEVPHLPRVLADRDRVLQVFSNLLGNAIDLTPRGGRVTLVAQSRPAEGGGEVVFRVRDTGPGIPEEQLASVFERYWRGNTGRRRGAGLGLAIAKGIVEAHGGTIGVESRPGEGTTFHFSLPVAGDGPVAPPAGGEPK